jgi:hypothetical protein
METKFQTSFIPKKPLTPQNTTSHAPTSTSILMLFAMIVFIGSLVWGGYAFFGPTYYAKVQEQYKKDLADNEKRFNAPLIQELSRANAKIEIAKQLLKGHLAVSEAISIISGLTAEKVRFATFEFIAPDTFGKNPGHNDGSYKIKMKGYADGFNSIAFQSDVFGKSDKYGTNKVVKNPILSDLAVDESGEVGFNFSADLAFPDISYEKVLSETLQAEGSISSGTPN